MNKFSTLIGIIFSSVLVVVAIILGNIEGIKAGDMTGVLQYIDVASILIVVGGTIGSTLTAFSFSKIMNLLKVLKIAFFKSESDKIEPIVKVLDLTLKAGKDGPLAIQGEIDKIDDPYLAKGMTLVVDNTDPGNTRAIMEAEMNSMAQRHQDCQDILSFMADMAPAFGMIGTLVGLVAMLASLDDPSTIGPKMAVALLTTLYGAFLANVVFIPLNQKMAKRTEDELLIKESILEGILAFQSGTTRVVMEEKMKSYLSEPLKKTLEGRK